MGRTPQELPRIAIIGWGSIIWDARDLPIDGDWHVDGPALPLEFARISKNGRLTLVIAPSLAGPSKTCWALSSSATLEMARRNLCDREETIDSMIHSVSRDGGIGGGASGDTVDVVGAWVRTRALSGAIWTGLGSNWATKRGCGFSVNDALTYLDELPQETADKAKEYIIKAPDQIMTPLRITLQRERGWCRE